MLNIYIIHLLFAILVFFGFFGDDIVKSVLPFKLIIVFILFRFILYEFTLVISLLFFIPFQILPIAQLEQFKGLPILRSDIVNVCKAF